MLCKRLATNQKHYRICHAKAFPKSTFTCNQTNLWIRIRKQTLKSRKERRVCTCFVRQIDQTILPSTRACNRLVVNGQEMISSNNADVEGRMSRAPRRFIRVARSHYCGFLFQCDGFLDLLENLGDRRPHVPMWLDTHQSSLRYFPHRLDVVVVA